MLSSKNMFSKSSIDLHSLHSLRLTKIALLVGVPVLVGAAAYYYYSYSFDSKGPTSKRGKNRVSLFEQVMKLKELGNKSFSRKLYDIAITHYSDAIKLANESDGQVPPNDLAIFYQNRAACSEALGKFEDVIRDCSSAIDLNKKYVKAYLRRAKAYKSVKEFSKAIIDSQIVNFLEKFQNQASLCLAELCATESSKIKAAEKMKTCVNQWPAQQEIKNYFASFSQDPIFEKTENQIIKTEKQLQELYDEAVKAENESSPIWTLVRGTCLSLLGKTAEAKECYDKLIDQSDCPKEIKSNALLKRTLLIFSHLNSMENIEASFKKILELLDRAAVLDPLNPDIFLCRAKSYLLWEKPENALENLNQALKLNPDFHAALAHRIYIEFKLDSLSNERPKDPLAKCKEAIAKYPNSVEIRTTYAQMLLEMNYFEQADEELLNIATLNPTEADPIITRALLHMQLGDTKKAVTLFEECRKIEPRNKTIYDFLGSIEVQRSNIDEAIKLFEIGLNCCRTEEEFMRFYSLLESCECHKAANEIISQL